MTLAKVKEQDGMTLAKVKEQDGMMLAKVKEQDGIVVAKVKVPSIPTLSGLIAVMICNKCGILFLHLLQQSILLHQTPSSSSIQAADVVILGTFTFATTIPSCSFTFASIIPSCSFTFARVIPSCSFTFARVIPTTFTFFIKTFLLYLFLLLFLSLSVWNISCILC